MLGTFLVVQWLRLLPTHRVAVGSLGREIRSHEPVSQKAKTKKQNRSNIVTNSIETLKMVRIKNPKQTNKQKL